MNKKNAPFHHNTVDAQEYFDHINLLLIEDDPNDAYMAQRWLKQSRLIKFKFEWAKSLKEAKEKLRNHKFDIVCLDLNLPDGKGITLVEEIAHVCGLFSIVLLSGPSEHKDDAKILLENGVQDYLEKDDANQKSFEKMIQFAAQRKHLLLELRAQKEFNENIIASMVDPLILLNPDGTIKHVNQAFCDLLKNNLQTFIGKPFHEFLIDKEIKSYHKNISNFPIHLSILEDILKHRIIKGIPISLKGVSGKLIPVSFSAAVMYDNDDNVVGIVCIAKDMSEYNLLIEKANKAAAAAAAAENNERKKATELNISNIQLKSTQTQLVQAGKLKAVGQFVAGIAHELNNPLSGCLLKTQLAIRQLTPSETKVHAKLKSIEAELIRSTNLVRDLLTFSSPKKNEDKFKIINICEIFDKAIALSKGELKFADIEVNKIYENKITNILANADSLLQVFLNIISNAIDAIDEKNKKENKKGGIFNISTKTNDVFIEISCNDTGCGIVKEEITKLFNPFHTTKEPGKGTGLGLAVSHSIIQAHGGEFEVKSEAGKGSTFIIKLPIVHKERKTA